ncbi:MAG: PadR family transcriptional regulator [Planctomycetota bacterium]|jgi:DNA-binding PadR family transcriptional regulator
MKLLTQQEELVLLAVYKLGKESSLLNIRELLIEIAGKRWSISSIYVPLDRSRKNGYLTTSIGTPEAKRGGKAVKYYHLTPEGLKALSTLKTIKNCLWEGIDQLALEG